MMVSGNKQHRQSQRVGGHSQGRFEQVVQSMFGMSQGVVSPQQSADQQGAAAPAGGWHLFLSHGFVAPDKLIAFADHAPEKILVFAAGTELGAERRPRGIEDGSAKQESSRRA